MLKRKVWKVTHFCWDNADCDVSGRTYAQLGGRADRSDHQQDKSQGLAHGQLPGDIERNNHGQLIDDVTLNIFHITCTWMLKHKGEDAEGMAAAGKRGK